MLFEDVLVVGGVKSDLMDLHQCIDGSGKASQSVCLEHNLQTFAMELVRKVDPILCNRFEISSSDVGCTRLASGNYKRRTNCTLDFGMKSQYLPRKS